MSSEIITLPDGYNGETLRFYVEPIERDNNLLKLRCAEPGKEYLIRWAHISDMRKIAHKLACPHCQCPCTDCQLCGSEANV